MDQCSAHDSAKQTEHLGIRGAISSVEVTGTGLTKLMAGIQSMTGMQIDHDAKQPLGVLIQAFAKLGIGQ